MENSKVNILPIKVLEKNSDLKIINSLEWFRHFNFPVGDIGGLVCQDYLENYYYLV